MKKNLIIILVVLAGVGTIFYWFSLRPSNIRKECLAEAEFNSAVINEINDSTRQNLIDDYYKNCLRRQGIEK